MAETTIATGATLARKAYDEKLFRDSVKETFFGPKMMSQSGAAPVYVQTDLEKGKGETIVFGLRSRLTGAGVTGESTLEGNEEDLATYSLTVTLDQYRHAVRDNGALSRKRPAFDLEAESKMALQDWGAEKIDQLIFDGLGIGTGASVDPTKVFYRDSSGDTAAGSAATAKAALNATNSKLHPNFISAIKTWAKNGGGRTYVPIRPIKIDGKDYYVLLVHNDCLFDLKTNSTYQQFLREAEVRGKENPLFTGAVAIIDGVVIHEHENCAIATDGGGASVAWGKGIFMGQQAVCWAWGQRPKMVEETFDYGNKHGKAWGIISGVAKSKFNSLDYGSVGVWLSRTNVSGL